MGVQLDNFLKYVWVLPNDKEYATKTTPPPPTFFFVFLKASLGLKL